MTTIDTTTTELPAPATRDLPLNWSQRDIEQRLGFRGARFTRVNSLFSVLLATGASVLFYLCLLPFRDSYLAAMFNERGWVPYLIVFFTAWSSAILVIKFLKLRLQSEALNYQVTPRSPDFVLSAATVEDVLERIHATVDDPKHFVLFNRIVIALSNLRNLGRVGDVDEILRSQADQDESAMETSYSLLQGFVWAIPVLGFIGTVLGLSAAIGGFSAVLQGVEEVSEIVSSLQGVTIGLAVAFETTLEALIAALVIQLMLTMVKKKEEEFLDACSEYCGRHVVGKLRIVPFDGEES